MTFGRTAPAPSCGGGLQREERGRGVAGVGGVRDRAALALTAGRMREDPVSATRGHHFLRTFDKTLQVFEKNASDAELADLAETRTARAFMLFGRVMGCLTEWSGRGAAARFSLSLMARPRPFIPARARRRWQPGPAPAHRPLSTSGTGRPPLRQWSPRADSVKSLAHLHWAKPDKNFVGFRLAHVQGEPWRAARMAGQLPRRDWAVCGCRFRSRLVRGWPRSPPAARLPGGEARQARQAQGSLIQHPQRRVRRR